MAPLYFHSKVLIGGFGCPAHARPAPGLRFAPALRPARTTGKKKCARQSDNAPVRVFLLDLARSGAAGKLPGRSGARFLSLKLRFLRCFLLRACTVPHNLPTLTKHCVGAQILSFRLFAIVPTSSENSLRTLFGKGFAVATRSPRAWERRTTANLVLESANLTHRIANLAPKIANLVAKTAQLGPRGRSGRVPQRP